MDNFNNPPITNTPGGAPPENYLIWSILTTIFCCWPIGIFAILKAAQVRELWALGDIEGSIKASKDAKKIMLWGALGWLLLIVIPMIIMFSLGIFGSIMNAGSY